PRQGSQFPARDPVRAGGDRWRGGAGLPVHGLPGTRRFRDPASCGAGVVRAPVANGGGRATPRERQAARSKERQVSARRLVALSAMLVLSCAKRVETASSEKSLPAAAFYPLAVGNRWVYQANFLGEKAERTVQIVKEEDGFFFDNQGGAL